MKSIAIISLLLCLSGTMQAQTTNVLPLDKKLGLEVRQYLHNHQTRLRATKSVSTTSDQDKETVELVLRSNDGKLTEKKLQSLGISYKVISPTIFTAHIQPDQIEELAEETSVKRITGLQKRKLHIDKVRTAVNADDAHQGTDMETPFTGKGVIVGVIDQGFQYNHPAFLVTEDSTRVVSVLNKITSNQTEPLRGSANIIKAKEDGTSEAHGTHVAGIAAAGRDMGSENYYGMAPEAHIVMVASEDFDDADIMDACALIKEEAARRNEPFVINMSFGTNFCPHDGTEDLCQMLNELSDSGCIFITSAGNEGDEQLHASYTFTEQNSSCLLSIDHKSESHAYVYILCNDEKEISVTPYFQNIKTGERITNGISIDDPVSTQYYQQGLDENNGKNTFLAMVPITTNLRNVTASDYRLVLRINGTPGQHIDAFLNGNGPVFSTLSNANIPVAPYDNKISIGEPADAASLVTVGAYITRKSWKSIDGKNYGYGGNISGGIGAIAPFSSVGPMVDPELLKPDVAAPGVGIVSAIKKKDPSYRSSDNLIVEKMTLGIVPFYYGIMQGTSQASPAVAGVVALWLEANPRLTYKDIHQIISETSISDNNTKATWNETWGYGKINAYDGLKKALLMTNIHDTKLNTEQPITIQKEEGRWNILFNNQETYADVMLYNAAGQLVKTQRAEHIHAGQEETLNLKGLAPGVYVLKIHTQNSSSSRKVSIR